MTQADTAITRSHDGIGLGLTIAKYVATAFNGNITVESEVGKGSTFTCVVNVDYAEDPTLEAFAVPKNARLTDKSILVVDDIELNRELLVMFLEDLGATVHTAYNGENALEMFQGNSYDIVLMDIHMPVMDGFSAAEAIRNCDSEQANNACIIAVTADSSRDVIARCCEVGMNDHLEKPVDFQTLSDMIQLHMNK